MALKGLKKDGFGASYLPMLKPIFRILQKCLKEENKILQGSIDHHPEVKRFAIENLELRGE